MQFTEPVVSGGIKDGGGGHDLRMIFHSSEVLSDKCGQLLRAHRLCYPEILELTMIGDRMCQYSAAEFVNHRIRYC